MSQKTKSALQHSIVLLHVYSSSLLWVLFCFCVIISAVIAAAILVVVAAVVFVSTLTVVSKFTVVLWYFMVF